jgi:hypothetical protein
MLPLRNSGNESPASAVFALMSVFGKLVLLAVVLVPLALFAAPKPDFTGTWKLNLDESDLGGAPITALTVQIRHKDPEFKYTAKATVDGQDFDESETFTTDGKPGRDSRGGTMTAHWDGAVLVSDDTGPDGNLAYTSRMTLSEDGKTCTRDYVPADDQTPKRHEVYEKQ